MDSHYKSLKLNKSASQEDVKKAYHKLSHYNHPDRGGSLEKFKEILDAYAVLSNKKYIYRSKTFVEYYNGDEGGGKKKCGNVIDSLNVTLKQLYNRERVSRRLLINTICDKCHGVGAVEKVKICKKCNSSSSSHSSSECSKCNAKCSRCNSDGFIVKKECTCPKCRGKKVVKRYTTISLKLSPKYKNRECLIYNNKGHEYPKSTRGDILFIINILKDTKFTRVNKYDLYMKYTINLVEALYGFTFQFEHLDGRKIYADIQFVIKPGCKSIVGEGMIKGDSNLIVEFIVEFPRLQINDHEKTILENMFMIRREEVNINFDEYESCNISHAYNPYRRDETLEDFLS